MPKRPDFLEGVMIALKLLERIPAGRMVTAGQLHEQLVAAGFDRDKRTVERYLAKLSEHFEIECDMRSRPYGYRWKPRARGLSVPRLDEQASLLLTLAEQYLGNLLPAALMTSLQGFFDQARVTVTDPTQKRASRQRDWLKKVRIVDTTQPLLPPKIEPTAFEQISNALYADQWLELDYRNAAGKRRQSLVMPLGLAQQGPRLYLVVRFEGYKNERTLAIHRIIHAQATGRTFTPPRDFDLRTYDNDGRFGFGEGERIRLSFRIDKGAGLHLLESPLSTDQVVRDLGAQYEVNATVVATQQLEWWLLSFGDQVRDIERTPLP